jgi:hypothetical protein
MKITTLISTAFLAVAGLSAIAEISFERSSCPIIVVAEPESHAPAVSVVMRADFVSVPVRVVSDQKNTSAAYEETRQAIDLVARKAKESGQFRTTMGVVSLSQHRGGFGLSSGSWSEPAASAEIYLLVPFSTNSGSIFEAGARAARFVESLSLPGKIKCELGRLQLAVENPEQYRTNLLSWIRDDIKKTRETMAPQSDYTVAGLESPVMVQQIDDRNVALFLNYSFSVSEKK